ncbi:MAG: DNA-directed RNA polymerase subunit P [Candidatus Diapherotrites archaeon]
MSYKCIKCGDVFDSLPKGVIRCPKCAYKVLLKAREPVTKIVQAR